MYITIFLTDLDTDKLRHIKVQRSTPNCTIWELARGDKLQLLLMIKTLSTFTGSFSVVHHLILIIICFFPQCAHIYIYIHIDSGDLSTLKYKFIKTFQNKHTTDNVHAIIIGQPLIQCDTISHPIETLSTCLEFIRVHV